MRLIGGLQYPGKGIAVSISGASGDAYTMFENGSTIFEELADYNTDWYEIVSYKGSFGSENWIEGWTLLWEEGQNEMMK